MIRYKIVQFKNKESEYNNMYYARADHDETYDLDALVDHMASHNSPFSRGTISGVLRDMVSCIRELVLDSKKVKLDNLAIFSLGLKSSFAPDITSFNPSTNIKGARVKALGTGEFGYRQLQLDAKFKEKTEYSK